MQISHPEEAAPGIHQMSVSDLENLAAQYPYYSIAQFYLLARYHTIQSEHFHRQSSIAALYFHNQKWLGHQLYNGEKYRERQTSQRELVSAKEPATSPAKNAAERPQHLVNAPAFEPMHLIDYFASQGIKISDEAIPGDKLGNQLKSFTEWLKSMKKIHPEKIAEDDEQTDKKVRSLAEHSNAHFMIITEAMAEVLIKQGKIDQAVEMYEKLSLNNPPGNAYFAAKIKSLKSI